MTAAVGTLVQNARKIDPVYLALIALLVAIGAFSTAQLLDSLQFLAMAMISISPFLLLSMAAAGGAQATGLDQRISGIVQGRTTMVILGAAFFGSLAPLCSCGVIPLIAALLAAGVPLGPVMAFWIASPLMDPEMFVLMAPVMGLEFTIAKTLSAFSTGLVAGFATHALTARGVFSDPLKAFSTGGCAGPSLGPTVVWSFWRNEQRRALFAAEARTSGRFPTKWLTLAFALESLMVAYVPAEAITQYLGGNSP